MFKHGKTAVLAHYYAIPEVQALADYVGDSLDLAQWVVENKPARVVQASVRFMAETTKLLNPQAEVLLPSASASCSLVDQTNLSALEAWVNIHRSRATQLGKELSHVMYINSTVEMKALADIIVTSRNVTEIVSSEIAKGKYVIFSPDRNMGNYLNFQYQYDIPVWDAVCVVHDQFKDDEIYKLMTEWSDGPKYLLAHPESPLPILKRATVVGSTNKMLNWVKDFPRTISTVPIIYVATEEGLLYNMRIARPDLDIRQAPTYSGCQCAVCPFMKMNTIRLVKDSIDGTAGVKIDYLTDEMIARAVIPVNRMMEFK